MLCGDCHGVMPNIEIDEWDYAVMWIMQPDLAFSQIMRYVDEFHSLTGQPSTARSQGLLADTA